MVGGISAQVLETIAAPHAESGALFVSQAILAFGVAALLFTSLHTRRSGLWWTGAIIHVGAGVALPFAADIVTFFIAWEFVTIGAAMILAAEPNGRTLLKWYLPWQLFAAAMLLSAFALEFAETAAYGIPDSGLQAGLVPAGIALGIKSAVLPAHIWLINTYTKVRPTSAVVLAAVATKIGVFGIYRLIPGHYVLEIVGATLAVLAVLYALRQSRLRPFLAYHIISQVGFMIAGVGSANRVAQLGGLYHLGNHVMYKGLLFMVVAILIPLAGTADMYSLRGAGRKSVALTLSAFAGALSISGVPPFNGYVSKSVLHTSLESQTAVTLLTIAGIGTAISFTKFLWYGFLKPGPTTDSPRTARVRVHIVVGALAILTLSMGLFPTVFFPALPPESRIRFSSLLAGQVNPAIGAVLFFLLYRPLLRILNTVLPGSHRPRAFLRLCTNRCLDAMQQLHTGNTQRYLGWTVAGILVLWVSIILATTAIR